MGIPILSALIAGFQCLAEGLTTRGVAAFSKEEIIWYVVFPPMALLVVTLFITEFIAGARAPVTEAIEAVMNAIISLRSSIYQHLQGFIPRTPVW